MFDCFFVNYFIRVKTRTVLPLYSRYVCCNFVKSRKIRDRRKLYTNKVSCASDILFFLMKFWHC